MRILLHIGMPKTGSSSIQKTCMANADLLAGAGVFVPVLPPADCHPILSLPFFQGQYPRQFRHSIGLPKADLDDIAMHSWHEVARQVEAQGDIDTLLLSAEQFFSIDDHAALRQHLSQFFPGVPVEVLCYLREPVSYYASMLQQHGKASGTLFWPRAEGLADTVGRFQDVGQVTLRDFDRSRLTGGDAVADLLSIALSGRPIPDGLTMHSDNATVSAEAIMILWRYRHYIHGGSDDLFMPDSSRLFATLQAAERGAPSLADGLRPQLRAGLREAAIVAAHADLVSLRDRFGFSFADASLYDIASARAGVQAAALPRATAPRPEMIFKIDEDRLARLEAETFATLLQGPAARRNA